MTQDHAATIARQAITEALAAKTAPPRLPFHVLTAKELLQTKLAPRETILTPWLPAKGLAMVYGPRGIGKTLLTHNIAYAIASGGEFLRWKADKPRKVLILDGEMPGQLLQERINSIPEHPSFNMPSPAFLRILALDLQVPGRGLNLSDSAAQRDLDAVIDDAEVIIVDNISTLANGGRENEGESWSPIQDWALDQRRAGRTVLFVHHAGKGGAQRGTSRREDVLDTVIALRRPEDYKQDQGARFNIQFEKARGFYGHDADPFEAALGQSGWIAKEPVNDKMSEIVALYSSGMSERKIAAELGLGKGTVGRNLAGAREAGLLESNSKDSP